MEIEAQERKGWIKSALCAITERMLSESSAQIWAIGVERHFIKWKQKFLCCCLDGEGMWRLGVLFYEADWDAVPARDAQMAL